MHSSSTPELITDLNGLAEATSVLAQEELIGLDTEFIRETSFYPRMALIQVATKERAWLIDPIALNKKDLQPLLFILQDKKILKVIHAAHADQECFYWNYGLLVEPVLDTAVAAALCGMGDSIGLQKLLREALGVHVSKGRARAKWLTRPLSAELLSYAEQDVLHLVALAQALIKKLKFRDRLEWALEESIINPRVFDISPEELAEKIARGANLDRDKPVLTELIRWRESRAREANLPRLWVADNEILIALARTQPRTLDELKTFRGLHPKEVDRNGLKILEAIEKGKALMAHHKVEPRKEWARIDSHAADFIQTYISFLADQLEIMPRFLVTSQQAVRILHYLDKEPQQWVDEGILSRHAASLIGNELKALFSGKKALVLKNKKLNVIDLQSVTETSVS